MANLRCLILVLAVVGGLWGHAATAENPYAPIPQRNMFGLVPIPVHDPAMDIPVTPPPKITPNGIMTIFGKVQVLFKVQAPAVPGQPPKELSYTMGEGERQDEIEVQKIDEPAATITFNNHGQVQTLELAKNAGSAGPAPVPAPGQPAIPGASAVAHAVAPGGAAPAPIGFGGRFGRARGNANPDAAPAPNPNFGGVANNNSPGYHGPLDANGKPAAPVAPEEQVIMIEAQRMKAIQEKDPIAFILPPTEMTAEATGQENFNSTPPTGVAPNPNLPVGQ